MRHSTVVRARLRNGLIGLLCWVMLSSDPPQRDLLQQVQALGVLRVATINGPLTVFEEATGLAGLEHDLILTLAKDRGWQLDWRVFPNTEQALQAVRRGQAHLLAAAWTLPDIPPEGVRVTLPYRSVDSVIASRSDAPSRLQSLAGLSGKAVVLPAGMPADRLRAYAPKTTVLHSVQGQEVLLSRLMAGELEHVLVDSDALTMARRLDPGLQATPSLGPPRPKVWVVPEARGEALWRLVQTHLRGLEDGGELALILDRYLGTLGRLDAYSRHAFHARVQSRLPDFMPLFMQAAQSYAIDWRFLAAMAYQESAWDPNAVSRTGVQGLMMLTQATARELGVSDRTDPQQSIDGGARYLLNLRERVSATAQEPDRTWMALAAYNLGLGHVRDLQKLTQDLGGEPDRWVDLDANLPRLTEPRWYKSLRHGYARGLEARHYVASVRNYYDYLRWIFPLPEDAPAQQEVAEQTAPATAREWPDILIPGL